MGFLPAVGVFSYNGFTFNGSTKSKVRSTFIYDSADRTVKATVYNIWARTIVYNNGQSTDIPMLAAQQQLSKAGQQLVYNGQGNGGFTINVAGVRDVMWGPKPRVFNFESIGSAQAYAFEWECEVAIPACANAVYQFAPMAFNFSVDVMVDGDGYTTRTIKGELEIPMTRLNGGAALLDCADNYWTQVCPAVTYGFKRTEQPRTISEDKRTVRFSVTDEQIPGGGYPPGCTDFEGTHGITLYQPPGTSLYLSTISASYTVAPGAPRAMAAQHFLAMALDRASVANGLSKRLIVGFKATEGLGNNRKCSFDMTWQFSSNISDCMADGGMFRPVPNTDWNVWITSVGVVNAQSPTGFAGITVPASADAIVDLCLNQTTSTLVNEPPGDSRLISNVGVIQDTNPVDPNYSWLKYKCQISAGGESNLVRLKRMGPYVPTATGMGDFDAQGSPGTSTLTSAGLDAPDQQNVPQANVVGVGTLVNQQANNPPTDLFQQLGSPSYVAVLRGSAIRAGYKIPLPMLTTVGGANAMPAYQEATADEIIGNWSGVPIYYRRWHLEYNLDSLPDNGNVVTPGNPALFIPPN